MIGPRIEGYRTGERVQIADPAHPEHGAIGYIIGIVSTGAGAVFRVDIGAAKKSKRPMVRELASTQLHPAKDTP